MSLVLSVVRPANIQTFVATNAPGSLQSTGKQSWMAYLAANGGVGNTITDQEIAFLRTAGINGPTTLFDMWGAYATGAAGNLLHEKLRNLFT